MQYLTENVRAYGGSGWGKVLVKGESGGVWGVKGHSLGLKKDREVQVKLTKQLIESSLTSNKSNTLK